MENLPFTDAPQIKKLTWASGRKATKKPGSRRVRPAKNAILGNGARKAHPSPKPSRKAAIRAEKRELSAKA